jgi:hypothetical protein
MKSKETKYNMGTEKNPQKQERRKIKEIKKTSRNAAKLPSPLISEMQQS